MIAIISLSLALMIMSILYLSAISKYKKLFNKTNKIINDLKSPIRQGYYLKQLITMDEDQRKFEVTVYVKELDRYTNGDCKVTIERIEPGIDNSKVSFSSIDEFVRESFKSIMKASEITWLESEVSLKEQRKNKLEQLKESIKNN